jgi:hypothetical protein
MIMTMTIAIAIAIAIAPATATAAHTTAVSDVAHDVGVSCFFFFLKMKNVKNRVMIWFWM